MHDSTIVTERTYHGHLDLACEALADENAGLIAALAGARDDLAWVRDLLTLAVGKYAEQRERYLSLERDFEQTLDEFYDLRKRCDPAIRHANDRRAHYWRGLEHEVTELRQVADELRDLRSALARRAA